MHGRINPIFQLCNFDTSKHFKSSFKFISRYDIHINGLQISYTNNQDKNLFFLLEVKKASIRFKKKQK